MRYSLGTVVTLVWVLLLLPGCDSAGPDAPQGPFGQSSSVGESPETAGACADVGGYQICLTYAQYDAATSETTFLYTVTPSGATAHLRQLMLTYTTCTPQLVLKATVPSGAVETVEPTTGTTSLLFDVMQRKNEVKTYALTFEGEVATGAAQAYVTVGSINYSSWLNGPACEPVTYEITGNVYVESDILGDAQYGVFDAEEAGIPQVTVILTHVNGSPVLDASGVPFQDVTDATGAFAFSNVPAGIYHVVVPATTSAPGDCPGDCSADYNETLYLVEAGEALYTFSGKNAVPLAGGVAAVGVSLGPDAHVDLGFAPNTNAIVAALGGTLTTRNELPFGHFLPLLAGLASPDDLAKKRVPTYGLPIGSYLLRFDGRTYDPSLDRTRYEYSIERKGNAGTDVSHVTFGVDDCTPVAYEPQRISFGFDPTTGVSGAKFDFGVKRQQNYVLHFAGKVDPGVIDVGVKYGTSVAVVQMPGACAGSIGTEEELLRALDNVYYSGSGDPSYLFLQDPLVLPKGKSELAAAIELLLIQDPEPNGLKHLEQLLLVSQLIFDLGLGTVNPGFDATLFQFVEPIILFESNNPRATGKVSDIQAGTGGSGAGGSVLGGYIK